MKGYIRLSSYIFDALTSLDSPSPSFKTVVYFGVSSSSQGSYYGLRKEHSLLSALKLSRVFWDSRVLVGRYRCHAGKRAMTDCYLHVKFAQNK